MNRQAIVGLFTILGLLALFVVFFVLSNVGTGGRYKIGVHFKSASGIHKGALVYESGVNVGMVDSLHLLPQDFTVDIILAINNTVDIPRDARFIIQAPLTGDATLEIVPRAPAPRPSGVAAPTPAPGAVAVWPREVAPLEQQPQGTNPATLTDLLEQGQGEVTRLDTLLADLEQREPALLNTLQSALTTEQAAVWAYGLVAAYVRDQAAMIADARSGHLLRRDATTARLIQGGATPPEPAAAYQVPVAVTDAPSALALAQDIETDAAAAWRVVIGSTDDAELRGFALLGLSDAAVRLAIWKQVAGATPTTVPFPGQS